MGRDGVRVGVEGVGVDQAVSAQDVKVTGPDEDWKRPLCCDAAGV